MPRVGSASLQEAVACIDRIMRTGLKAMAQLALPEPEQKDQIVNEAGKALV